MSVTLAKSSPVLVGPSEPEMYAGINVNLSSFDECVTSVAITSLLVFDQPIQEPVNTIKRALSQALVHYRPFAGRQVVGVGDGKLRIACTGEGVMFVSASASCALEDVPMSTLLKELAVYYPDDICGNTDALLLTQVTEFSCGGFVVAVTWNHAIADGAGMAQFLQAVGDLARGMPAPCTVPIREETDKIPVLPPATVAMYRYVNKIAFQGMVPLDITVPSRLVHRIKAEFDGSEPCTVFEAVTAVLWRCRTRAIISDPKGPAALCFSYNMRGHVGAKDGYYGNCFTMQAVYATSGTVANSTIGDLVKLIKRAKESILDTLNGVRMGSAATQPVGDIVYNMFGVSSWRNLGFDSVDFGQGRPARVMWHMEQASGLCSVVCPPCKGKDDVNVMSLCFKPEHVDTFLGELASM